jgi:hypothetical protein
MPNAAGGICDSIARMSQPSVQEVSFDERSVLEEAMRRAEGLSDFGDDSFREALRRLLDGLEREAKLHAVGRVTHWERTVGLLVNRLRLEHYVARHPEILQEHVHAPVVVVGFPRTGTTMLHRLIGSDPGMNAVLWWECRNPAPFPGDVWGDADPRIAAAKEEVRQILEAQPELASIHPWDPLGPDEEIMLLENSFLSWTPESFANLPSFGEWRAKQDLTPAYAYLKRQLQFLQWQKRKAGRCGDRWVLKAPFHLGYIDLLFTTFPDAMVIQTHRDPLQTVPSFASMTYYLWKLGSDEVNPLVVGEQWGQKFHDALYACMQARDRRWDQRFIDVWYRDVARDPVRELRRVYQRIGRELTPEREQAMRRWAAANARENRPPHEYTLEQFGYTEDGIRQYFAEYRRRYIQPRS